MAIEFKSEILYGDKVELQVGVAAFNRAGFDLVYIFNGIRNGQTFLSAKAKTAMICYDYGSKKVVAMPVAAAVLLDKYKY